MARGVSFQLVESLGVLERQKVAEEVKGLDQPARATLRKYGVRFGAYHVYLPVLLKPAPRALATQLWAVKHESPDAKGVSELLHLAASGRTSIPVDQETPKALYRTAGYRICGERAVRVDILERLADLIRPALSWREGSPGPKPDGVFDGRGFLITGAMTSLTGASGEDFASILRSLGYRMDRKPKPIEPAAPASAMTEGATAPSDVAAETAPVSDAPSAQTEPLPSESAPAEIASAAEMPSRSLLPEPDFVTPEIAPLVHESAPAMAKEAAKPETTSADAGADAAAAGDATPTAPAQTATAEEPAFIEVWRPAGRSDRRPHRPRRHHRAQPTQGAESGTAPATTIAPAEGVAASAPSDATSAERGPRRQHERSNRPERKEHQQRQERRERQQRMERQGARSERQDRGRRRDRGESVDRAEREQYYAKPFGNRSGGRDKQPDPNSPFAKLAVLKQQLEQSSKEPS
jgi:ATP-dependent RNA helicase SUPV3L1/SUV3